MKFLSSQRGKVTALPNKRKEQVIWKGCLKGAYCNCESTRIITLGSKLSDLFAAVGVSKLSL